MAWPLNKLRNKQRDEIVAVDLGGRHTKAVHIQNRGGRFRLLAYTIQDSPTDQGSCSVDVLAEHLKMVSRGLGDRAKTVTIALGSNETVVRRAELPPMPLGDMRQLLKFNSKNYLQQELPDHLFDCAVIIPKAPVGIVDGAKAVPVSHKQKVLVGAAKRTVVEDAESAAKAAGLVPAEIIPGIIGPINAFEAAEPEAFSRGAVALVELGFRSSTICMLQAGELVMHRVVNIGGDRLTAGLAEAMNISYAEAEGIKVGMPQEVLAILEPLVSSLGRELRAFVDFFEHQQDVAVAEVYLSGGPSRSELIVQALQQEIVAPCKTWNPVRSLEAGFPADQAPSLESIAPQFCVAVGAALAAL